MKKIISYILLITLLTAVLCTSALPVSAASMSLGSSSATVYRGDAFSLSVVLNNNEPVSNGGVVLSYDSSVFELVGGSCNVSNAALAQVSTSNNGGVFALQEDAVVSGTIFTINMKVKDGASFGTYSISGSWSLNIGSGSCGTSVTVACKHSFGSASMIDGTNHQSTCSVCGEKKTESHIWNSGTVTKEATCKETGITKLTCTACSATKEETVSVTNNHKYGSWSKVDGNSHTHTCSVCGKKENTSHTWNNGTVIKAATCEATGEKKLTCTACNAEKTATIPIADHNYIEIIKVDDNNHTKTCKDCGKVVKEAHKYPSSLSNDANWHYKECSLCGFKTEEAAHVPGPEATLTTDQICTVCGRILQPAGEHIHTWADTWTTDETGHWYACGSCNEKENAAPHEFENDCDAECDICLFIREPLHVADSAWSSDKDGHWHVCVNCGEKIAAFEHEKGAEATITSPQLCTVCEYEIAPVVPHDHIYDENGTLHQHLCVCGEAYEAEMGSCDICKPFPWWIVCIAEALVFGAVIVVLFIKKKNNEEVKAVEYQEEQEDIEAFEDNEEVRDVKSLDEEQRLKNNKKYK